MEVSLLKLLWVPRLLSIMKITKTNRLLSKKKIFLFMCEGIPFTVTVRCISFSVYLKHFFPFIFATPMKSLCLTWPHQVKINSGTGAFASSLMQKDAGHGFTFSYMKRKSSMWKGNWNQLDLIHKCRTLPAFSLLPLHEQRNMQNWHSQNNLQNVEEA